MTDKTDHQLLANQLCFPLYAASRLVTRSYQPYLEQHQLTYPQYIVLMILWQQDHVTIKHIGEQALLNTNTLTPLLKRMQQANLITRQKDSQDERKILISLTEQGWQLKNTLACIPNQLIESTDYDINQAQQLKTLLEQLINQLK